MTRRAQAIAVGVLLTASRLHAQGAPPAAAAQPPARIVETEPTGMSRSGPWGLMLTGFGGNEFVKPGTASQGAAGFDSGGNGGVNVRGTSDIQRRRFAFTADAETTSVHYASSQRTLTDARAATSQSISVGRHSSVQLSETVSYAPYYAVGLFPGLGSFGGTDLTSPYVPSFDSALQLTDTYRYGAALRVLHPITDRTRVSLSYELEASSVPDAVARASRNRVGAEFSHRMTRAFGYHLGYGVDVLNSADPSSDSFQNVDVGIDAERALSRTRRTTVGFTTGSTIARLGAAAASDGTVPPRKTDVRLTGSANLNHYMGRSWAVRATYARDWQQIEGEGTPFFSDRLAVGTSGSVNARTTIGLRTSYVIGAAANVVAGSQNDRASISNAWVRVSATRQLLLFVQYGYYNQHFEFGELSLDLPQRVSRHSLRVGVVLGLPGSR